MDDLNSAPSRQEETPQPPQITQTQSVRHKPLFFLLLLIVPLIVGLSIWMYNNVTADKPLQRVLASDPRNAPIKEHARYDGWFDVHTLVFDVDDVTGEASRMDVLRTFLEYAEAMKDRRFKTVILACRGNRKFQMDGAYFQQLGIEFSTQNPMYTIRTLPINVTAMDGSHPYEEYEGGIFAVLSKELEQFGDFSDRWYGKDLFLAPEEVK